MSIPASELQSYYRYMRAEFKRARCSQVAFAKHCGIWPTTLCRALNKTGAPSRETLKSVARTRGTTVDAILGREPHPVASTVDAEAQQRFLLHAIALELAQQTPGPTEEKMAAELVRVAQSRATDVRWEGKDSMQTSAGVVIFGATADSMRYRHEIENGMELLFNIAKGADGDALVMYSRRPRPEA